MAVPGDVLVGVGGFAVDIEVEGAIRVADNGDVQHGDFTVLLNFLCPLDVRMNGVQVVVEWFNVLVVYCDKCVIGLPQPKEDQLTGTDGTVASWVVGKGCSLEILHVDVG